MKNLANYCKTGLKSRVCAIVGSQWGDEGKGKLTDILANKYDICARYNGGDNAGHTIVIGEKRFAFHLLPSGMLNPKCLNIIGNGVVVNLKSLKQELEILDKEGIDYKQRLLISDRSHLIFQAQIDADISGERDLADNKIGTTKKGIGPAYASKAARVGVRVCDLLDWEPFVMKYRRLLSTLNKNPEDYLDELNDIKRLREFVIDNKMIGDTVQIINEAYGNHKRILAEGANANMLDIDFGTYPFVTSSSTSVGGICTGLGIPPKRIETVIGVTKAYTTRVGSGPFPTECIGEEANIGEEIRKRGGEFGVTTKRERRVGWFDTNVLKYSNSINAFSSINLTKVDVLSHLKQIKIGEAYRNADGSRYSGNFPASLKQLSTMRTDYLTLPGWESDITGITDYNKLPYNCRNYIETLEELINVPITWIGTGPDRENTIMKPIKH